MIRLYLVAAYEIIEADYDPPLQYAMVRIIMDIFPNLV